MPGQGHRHQVNSLVVLIQRLGEQRGLDVAGRVATQRTLEEGLVEADDVRDLLAKAGIDRIVGVEAGAAGADRVRLDVEGSAQQAAMPHRLKQVEGDAVVGERAGQVAVEGEGLAHALEDFTNLPGGLTLPGTGSCCANRHHRPL